MITILCIGKIKTKETLELCNDYAKRISYFDKIEVIELKYSNQKEETKQILEYKEKHNNKIFYLLDEQGDNFNSINFSKKINKHITETEDIVFVIAGAEGIEKDKKELFKNKLSLSKLTFPHEIARILLLEQIYRSYMIINNRNYHKE